MPTTTPISEQMDNRLDMLRPTLFIGVGGTGLETLKFIKKRNLSIYPRDLDIFDYLSIDTRSNTDNLDPLDTSEAHTLIDNSVVQDVGVVLQTLEANYPHIHKWIPSIKNWHKFSDLDRIIEGADQCRALGRLLFHLDADRIISVIQSKIKSITSPAALALLTRHQIAADMSAGIEVFIVGSICGGTGSGQFIDLAYLCKNLGHQNTKVYGILGLPDLFSNVTAGTESVNEANAYAALRELDHFMSGNTYSVDYGFKSISYESSTPFNIVYLIDSPNEQNVTIESRDEACKMIASALFGLTAQKTRTAYHEYYVNDRHKLSMKTPNSNKEEYRTCYSSFGVASLIFPYREIANACAHKRVYELCQFLLKQIETNGYENDISYYLGEWKLKPEDLKRTLLKSARKPFESWFNNAMGNLTNISEKLLVAEIATEKDGAENSILPNEFRKVDDIVSKFMTDALPGLPNERINEATNSFFKAIVNNFDNKGIVYALKIIAGLREDIEEFKKSLQTITSSMQDGLKQYDNNLNFYNGRIDELIKQGFLKNLFDFDKETQLDKLKESSLHQIRDKNIKRLEIYLNVKIIWIYDNIDNLLSKNEEKINQIKRLLEGVERKFSSNFRRSQSIKNREGLDYAVLRINVVESIYSEISRSSRTIHNDIRAITDEIQIFDWLSELNKEDHLEKFMFNKHVLKIFTEIIKNEYNIYDELEKTGKFEEYVTKNLEVASSPFIRISQNIMVRGGVISLFEKDILGVSDKDSIPAKLSDNIAAIPASTGDNHSIVLVQTKHAFPLFCIPNIETYKNKCEAERIAGANPCYTYKSDIISSFRDITPTAKGTIDLYHRAVHAFDLGCMMGFICKKPKGRVWYYCDTRNDIDKGFTIEGGSGGGRTKTKEWFMDGQNRHYLESIENKCRQILMNMDLENFKQFLVDWKGFKNKAINLSKKNPEWQSKDDMKIPDYSEKDHDPKIIVEVSEQKRPDAF